MPVVIFKSFVTTSNVPSTFNVPKVVFPLLEFITTLFDEISFETPTEPLFEVIVTFANSPVSTVKSPAVVKLASPFAVKLVMSAESELIVTFAKSPVPSFNSPVVVKSAVPLAVKLVISVEPELIVISLNLLVPIVNLPSLFIFATFDTFNFPNVTFFADVISKSDNVASGVTTTFPVEVIVTFPPTFIPVVISKSFVTTSNVPSTFNLSNVIFSFEVIETSPFAVIVTFSPTPKSVVTSKFFDTTSNAVPIFVVAKVTSPTAFILASVFEFKSSILIEPVNDFKLTLEFLDVI